MPDNKEIINYIKRAFELKSQECYKQAIEMLYKAIAIEPDNTELLYLIGELYFLMHNLPRAIQYIQQILEKDETHIPSLKLLKEIYVRQNELFSAKETAEKIYGLSPETENLCAIINICGQLNEIDTIEKYMDKINSDSKCLYEYALALYKNGNFERVEELINKSSEIDPENEDCKILMGKIFYNRNELDKSKEIFDTFDKNSQNPEVLNYKGLFELDGGNFIEGIKYFSKAANFDKKNPIYQYNLGNAYFLNGWRDEAVDAYKKAICITPDNLDFRYSLAYLHYKYMEFDKSRKEVDFILENNPKYYSARVLKALLEYNEKNYLGAKKILLNNLSDGSDDDFTLSSLSKIEQELGKFNKAEEYLQTVISRNPDNLSYKCDLGDIYIKEKNYEKALEITQNILGENPNFIYGYILGAKASYAAEDFTKTKQFASEALTLDINCSEGYYYLSLVRVEEQDYEEAIECMKRAITFDVTNAGYYAKMADIYKLSGDVKTAFDYIKEAESIDNSEEYKILYREFAALNRK